MSGLQGSHIPRRMAVSTGTSNAGLHSARGGANHPGGGASCRFIVGSKFVDGYSKHGLHRLSPVNDLSSLSLYDHSGQLYFRLGLYSFIDVSCVTIIYFNCSKPHLFIIINYHMKNTKTASVMVGL